MVVDSPQNAATALNSNLGTISNWADTWHVDFNPSKTDSLIISRKIFKKGSCQLLAKVCERSTGFTA